MVGYQYYRTTHQAWKSYVNEYHSSSWILANPSDLLDDETPIVVYIEAHERTHQMLAQDSKFHPMSLIAAGTKLCQECAEALAQYGVTEHDTMFSAARKLQKIHSGLAPQRF